jgi:SAM-dependent methyltransferase
MIGSAKDAVKWMLFPGTNLHARLRYSHLPQYFGMAIPAEARSILDAGCGNGMLSYQAFLKGNSVLGISFKTKEVVGCRSLFNDYVGIPEERLRFAHANLYELDFPEAIFDEVICTEVLEHLRDDAAVCRAFWRWLKPGGVLHITAPNSEHPYNAAFPLDHEESGGHVRAGYTLDSYRKLLEPIGFRIAASVGLGGSIRQAFNRRIKEVQARFGAPAGIPLFLMALPFLRLERLGKTAQPFSLYVRAVKDGNAPEMRAADNRAPSHV